MIPSSKLITNALSRRAFSTTPFTSFKFKLTEEASREMEEKLKAKKAAVRPPETALFTKESSLIMGKVSSERYQDVVKVGIPKHRLNDAFLLYVRENDNIQAYDENNITKPGDWILVRRWPESTDEKVTHKVEKVVHEYGNYIDPLTNRRAFGLFYDDELEYLEKTKMDAKN